MHSENDTQKDPITQGETSDSPKEERSKDNEDTVVMRNRTEKGCIYPGRPLDSDAQQIKLSGCELLSVLGVGGMGCVYLAKQTHLNRLVAVKALKVNVADAPQLRQWLKNEAVTLGSINHPNIVSCHDVIYYHGRIFLVMEYVPGFMSVGSLVKKFGPMPADIVIHIILEVLRALIYVNEKGIIHRDIKPDNILVYNERSFQARNVRELFRDSDTRIKICDFGLAIKEVRDAVSIRQNTLVQGSPNYMAPEQIVSPDNIDFRADMYALAGTAIFMLTGKPPFQFEDVKEMFKFKLEHDLPNLNEKHTWLNTIFAKILARMGMANPTDRYDSYAELKRELEEIKPFIEKNSGFRKMRFWQTLSIALAVTFGFCLYFFIKENMITLFRKEKADYLTSTLGYWQGNRTGWYTFNTNTSSGDMPVLVGDDMIGPLELRQPVEAGNTLSMTVRRKNPGSVLFKVLNDDGEFVNLTWSCDADKKSTFFVVNNDNKSIADEILPLDKDGWYDIKFSLYKRNLIVFVNSELVYTGPINGNSPLHFSVNASKTGHLMMKNMTITKND